MEASIQENVSAAEGSDRKDGTENNRSDLVENLEQENVAEGEIKFGVGDYVWGKQNFWWPGKICKPSDSPVFAKKRNVKGYLPVSFYRNKPRFSWCRTSHVKPFAENFTKMSRLSDYKSFLDAVGEALQDFTRDFERQLSCGCVSSENQSDQDINRGIEQGVNSVAKGNHLKLFIDELKPGHVLNNLRHAATGSLDSWLQIRVLRSWLGAFYRKNIGCDLIEFRIETVNEGLEDKIGNVVNLESEFGEDGEFREEGNKSDHSGKRERKKSKYLSPPYTTPQGTTSKMGERMSSVAGQPMWSTIDVNEVLSVIKNLAIDPMDSSRKENLDQIAEFISAYLKSVCSDGQFNHRESIVEKLETLTSEVKGWDDQVTEWKKRTLEGKLNDLAADVSILSTSSSS